MSEPEGPLTKAARNTIREAQTTKLLEKHGLNLSPEEQVEMLGRAADAGKVKPNS
jgi:hypothetical protein